MKKRIITIPEIGKTITSLYTNDNYLYARSIVLCKEGDTYNEEFGKILSSTGAWLKAVRRDIKSHSDSLAYYEEALKEINKLIISTKEKITAKKDKEEELVKAYDELIEISSDSEKVEKYVADYLEKIENKRKEKELKKVSE